MVVFKQIIWIHFTFLLYLVIFALPAFTLPVLGATKSESKEYLIQKNAYLEFQLEATSDLEGDLQYQITKQPSNGILEGIPPNLSYIPDDDYQGIDEIRFKALDSSKKGNEAIIRVQVGSSTGIPNLKEEFITLKITNTVGSRFWKVMLDGEERPYLEITETSGKWLDVVASCEAEVQKCTLKLHQLNKTFHIDGQDLSFGEEDAEVKKLPLGGLVVRDGQFWLRYDVWEQWIPITALWNVDQYFLNFNPSYPLLADLQNQRKRAWQTELLRLEQQKKMGQLEVQVAEPQWNAEAKYQLKHQTSEEPDSTRDLLAFDISSELYGGTLLLSGSSLHEQAPGPPPLDQTLNQATWNYQLLHQDYFDLLEAGDFLAPGGGLFPHLIVENGLRVKRKPEIIRTQNDLQLRGQSLPNTEVTLSRGGFLLEVQQTQADGSYQFSNLKYAGGELLRLKFYYPDGSTSEEVLPMAIDQGLFLLEGEWDLQMFTGEYALERFHWVNYGYAPNSHFTLGVTLYQFPEHWALETDSNLAKINAAYRPFWGAIFSGEFASHKNGMDSFLQADITWLSPHFFRFSQTSVQPLSPILNFLNLDRHRESITEFYHSISWSRWYWQMDLKQDEQDQMSRLNLRRHLTSSLSLSVMGEQTTPKVGTPYQRSELTADYIRGNHALQATVGNQPIGSSYSASYRYQGRGHMPYDIRLTYMQPPLVEALTTLSVSWYPFENISVDAIQGPRDSSSMAFGFHGVLAPEIGSQKYEDFGKGTLTGFVFLPDGVTPIQGVVVQAGSNRGVTDENGRYIVPGIPSEQDIKVSVVSNSLELGTASVDVVKLFRFRPSTTIEYNPRLTSSIGFDGLLVCEGVGFDGLRLEVFSVKEMKKLKDVAIEEDGFFIVENIPPGKYQLRIQGIENPPKPMNLELDENSVWVSEVKFIWKK